MDLAFFRRAEQMLAGRSAVRLDYGLLVAMLRAQQTGNAAAREAAAPAGPIAAIRQPLAEILLGGPNWREAVLLRRGSFYPGRTFAGNAA